MYCTSNRDGDVVVKKWACFLIDSDFVNHSLIMIFFGFKMVRFPATDYIYVLLSDYT